MAPSKLCHEFKVSLLKIFSVLEIFWEVKCFSGLGLGSELVLKFLDLDLRQQSLALPA